MVVFVLRSWTLASAQLSLWNVHELLRN